MNLRNNFTPKTKSLFLDVRYCMRCKRVDLPLQDDHIFQRVSNSALNLSRLCVKCHFLKARHGQKGKIEQLRKTSEFLARQGYVLTEKDEEFLEAIKSY